MLQLIKLEFMKFNLKKQVRGIFIANLIILAIMSIFLIAIKTDNDETPSYGQMLIIVDVVVRATFLIYSAVIMSIIVIEEYEKKTIYQLFCYPISRQKIIFAKLLIVSLFACSGIIIGEGIVTVGVIVANKLIHALSEPFSYQIVTDMIPCYIVGLISSFFLSFVPYTFGMRKKSSQSIIVPSIIIVVLLSSNINGVSSGLSIIIRELILGIVAVGLTVGSVMKHVKHIEEDDV